MTSWVFPKGHRIRVAISNALWPMILPTPYAMTTSLELGGDGGSRIVFPVVPIQGVAPPKFSPPQPSEERNDIKSEGFPWPGEWTVERDEGRQKTTVHWKGKDGYTYPWGKQDDVESTDVRGGRCASGDMYGARRGGERFRAEGADVGLARTSAR